MDEWEEYVPSKPEPIGRMRWNRSTMTGEKMSDGNDQTLAGSLVKDWTEETEKQTKCGWWSVDDPHPFRTTDGSECILCGARRVQKP